MTDGGVRDDRGKSTDVDPAELQAQLQRIKGAMGIEDRYPGQRRLWLVYGVVVAVAAIATEVVFASTRLSEVGYVAVWAVLVLVAGVAQWRITSGTTAARPPNAPPLKHVLGALLGTFLALILMSGGLLPYLTRGQETGIVQGAYYFGLLVAVAGLGFLLVGTVLRAYYIRRRDRLVFHAAGAWMLVFAALVTQFEFLRLFGYALFGLLFFLHSIVAYVLLGRSAET